MRLARTFTGFPIRLSSILRKRSTEKENGRQREKGIRKLTLKDFVAFEPTTSLIYVIVLSRHRVQADVSEPARKQTLSGQERERDNRVRGKGSMDISIGVFFDDDSERAR